MGAADRAVAAVLPLHPPPSPPILNVLLVALTACVLLPLWLARQRSAVLLGLLALGAVAWAAFTQPPAVQ